MGASGGIGSATADAFEAASATVLRPSREELDVTDNAKIEQYFKALGPVDHIVVAASNTETGSITDLPLASAIASMDSKFFGAYRIARAAKLRGNGSITFLSGVRAIRPSLDTVLLGAVNAALDALAKGLALEISPARANSISPGITDTPLYAAMPDDQRKEMFEAAAHKLPAKRVGSAEDIAQAILFAASNPFVTGATILVDGGGAIAS